MWMFLALLGAVAAAGVADHVVQAGTGDDVPGDDPPTDDDGFGTGEGGDLLTLDAQAVMPPDWQPGDAPDALDAPAPAQPGPLDGMPVLDPGPGTPELTPMIPDYQGWQDEDTFISSDTPVPPPSDDYIEADIHGTPVLGGDGDDTLLGGIADDRLDGEGGADSLIGGEGADTLLGGGGADTLSGGGGDDVLDGGGGAGLLLGDGGDDSLTGGAQNDTLLGGTGDDTMTGGYGDDLLLAGEGQDLLMGGSGADTLIGYAPDADGRDIDGGDFLNGGAGDDLIVLGSGDMASGGAGGDDFVLGPWIDPAAPALIGDFNAEDGLILAFDGTGPEPVIGMAYDAQAGGVVLRANGAVMAVLQGVTSIDPEAISLMPLVPPT